MRTLRDLEQEKKEALPLKHGQKEGEEFETASESHTTRSLIKLELFSNGYVLDEEPFRDYKSPSNREILSLIKKGRVPPHLRDKYPHDDIMIDFKDKRGETWKLPSFQAFSGKGAQISDQINAVPQQSIKEDVLEGLEKVKRAGCTKVKINLASGQNLTLQVDPDLTVKQLYKMVEEVAPTGCEFELRFGFPPKSVEEQSRSLRELGLLNSAATQKIL